MLYVWFNLCEEGWSFYVFMFLYTEIFNFYDCEKIWISMWQTMKILICMISVVKVLIYGAIVYEYMIFMIYIVNILIFVKVV